MRDTFYRIDDTVSGGFMNSIDAQLIDKEILTASIIKLTFKLPGIHEIHPGQHVKMYVDKVWKSYSVAETVDGRIFTIYVKMVVDGSASRLFASIKPGDTMRVVKSIEIVHDILHTPAICIGLGTGVVPLYSIVKHNLEAGFKEEVLFLYGAHDEADLVYSSKLTALEEKYENVSLKMFFSNDSQQQNAQDKRVSEYLYDHIDAVSDRGIFISARDTVAVQIRTRLIQMNVESTRIQIL